MSTAPNLSRAFLLGQARPWRGSGGRTRRSARSRGRPRRLAAEERAREPHRLGGRHRREVDAVGDIADGMDRIDRASGILVDHDRAVRRELDAGRLEAEVGGVGLAAGGEQHEVRLLVRAVGVADLEAPSRMPYDLRSARRRSGSPCPCRAHLLGERARRSRRRSRAAGACRGTRARSARRGRGRSRRTRARCSRRRRPARAAAAARGGRPRSR